MDKNDKRRRDEELDRFWDIDALIPKRRAPYTPSSTDATEIVLEEPKKDEAKTAPSGKTEAIPKGEPKRHFIPPHSEAEALQRPAPLLDYVPDNALVRRVRIYPWKSHYRYYEGFVRDAERLYAAQGASCPRVPFFSYVPQYSQMNRPQLEWYLWWRACVRRGESPDTDYSYVLLYAYELINLSHKTDALETQRELCKLWQNYRATFHQLDTYLPDWICDHSLIHRLPPPAACTGELLSAVMAHCGLKEFYVPSGGEDGYVRALLAFCSNYQYRKSKFCTAEHSALFDRVITGALAEVSRHMSVDGKLFAAAKMDDSRLLRDAYTGALCSYQVKRKIEVDYCSFSRSHELRFFITDVVKYTENRIRQSIGVRSRLTVYALSFPVRQLLDAYLDGVLPKRAPIKSAEEPTAAYEKLYDLPKAELSLEHAAEIERVSWDTTERLVEAFADVENSVESPFPPMPLQYEIVPQATEDAESEQENAPTNASAFAAYLAFLQAVQRGDGAGQRTAAKEAGALPEVLADEVNGIAADLFGDILLEECDGAFAVIEDYREILEEILK